MTSVDIEESGPIKILVAGDTRGKFKELFDRVGSVHRKNGPFHLLLCVGDFFPDVYSEDLVIPPAPIPTYILGPTKTTQLNYFSNLTGCEIAENITYLGQRGIYNDARGLKLAYFSGTSTMKTGDKNATEFDYEDVRNFEIRVLNEVGFKGVDILMTSQWPTGIEKMAGTPPPQPPEKTTPLISRLASTLKPRYHFAGLEGIHYERAPYRNHQILQEASQHTTRFISLATVGNGGKKKWLYAFNIVPLNVMPHLELVKQPDNVTEFPFHNLPHSKPPIPEEGEVQKSGAAPSNQFFYDSSYTGQPSQRGGRGRRRHDGGGGEGHDRGDGRGGFNHSKRGRGGGHPGGGADRPPPGPCWFCLASPEVEKHLIISIGDAAYVTLAKGGLTDDHILILPIGHYQSTIECPPDVAEEITKFKMAIKKYFGSIGKGVVFYERNFKSPHLQIQAVPVPAPNARSLKVTCLDFADSEEIEMQDFPSNADLFQMTRAGFPYFYMELPDDSKLFVAIKGRFPLQFGRELLASEQILNCPEKVDWKMCKMTKDDEIKFTKEFRDGFSTFDFTLQ